MVLWHSLLRLKTEVMGYHVFIFVCDWKLGVWSLALRLTCNALFSLCCDLKMPITVAAHSKA
jgi:hypothetical protein